MNSTPANQFQLGGRPRFAHQKEGLKRLIRQNGSAALLYDPGTGKTATVLDYLSVLSFKNPQRETRVLIVAPLAALDTWVLQLDEWLSPQVSWWAESLSGPIPRRLEALASRGGSPFKKPLATLKGTKFTARQMTNWSKGRDVRAQHAHKSHLLRTSHPVAIPGQGPDTLPGPRLIVEVLTLESLSQTHSIGSRSVSDLLVEAVKRYSPHVIVIDESHRIKGHGTRASRTAARIGRLTSRRVILTGTVMPHSPLDVYGQWRFLDPYAFGRKLADGSTQPANFAMFKGDYAESGGYMGRDIESFKNLDRMRAIMGNLAHVVKKEDALDLPKNSDVVIPCHLNAKEARAYDSLKKSLSATLATGEKVVLTSVLTQALRLRQVTAGYLPDDDANIHQLGTSKVDTIKSVVNDQLAGEKRIVVFAAFRHEIDMLREALAAEGTDIAVITGDTKPQERLDIRQRFGSDDPTRQILIAQIRTISLGVNELVTASHAVFASQPLQRDDMVQAKDRLNRLGQKRPVTFWHVHTPGSIDEVIYDTHRDRASIELAILRHLKG